MHTCDAHISCAVPRPTLFLDVRPVEVTYNKRQWETLLALLAAALQNTALPASCHVHYASPMPAPPPQPPIDAYHLRFALNALSVCMPSPPKARASICLLKKCQWMLPFKACNTWLVLVLQVVIPPILNTPHGRQPQESVLTLKVRHARVWFGAAPLIHSHLTNTQCLGLDA
jgi:hypothetical protein